MASADALKKAFLIGVGASVVTAEKVGDFVRDVVDDLVDRGEMTKNDARELADDLKKRVTKEKSHLQDNVKSFESNIKKSVDAALRTTVKTLGLVTQDDLKKFRDDITRKQSVQSAMKSVAEKTRAAKKTLSSKPKTKAGSAAKKSTGRKK